MPLEQVSYQTITAEDVEQRLDNFLFRLLKGVPKTHVYRLLRTGQIRVNKKRVKPAYRLQFDDIIRLPPLRLPSAKEAAAVPTGIAETLLSNILYEDEVLIALNKPSGVAVHGGSGLAFGVIEALRQVKGERLELIHRLDRETSGCLLIAKKRSMLTAMHELIRLGKIEKYYVALVAGRWQHDTHTVNLPLRKNTLRSGERMVSIALDGKPAKTRFSLRQHYAQASLMDIQLFTGRTHQIRVHAAHMKHAVAGDDKYGDKVMNKMLRQTYGLRRLFLHAERLVFEHPLNGQTINLQAPLTSELEACLTQLKEG